MSRMPLHCSQEQKFPPGIVVKVIENRWIASEPSNFKAKCQLKKVDPLDHGHCWRKYWHNAFKYIDAFFHN